MSIILKKKYGFYLLAIAPLLLLSNAKFATTFHDHKSVFEYGSYCATDFKMGTEITYDGTKLYYLKFQIEDEFLAYEHSIEFMISSDKEFGEIGPGKYRIVKDENGLLNFKRGVFGFLNSKDSKERPFFADFGEITFKQIDNKAVKGIVDVHFKNYMGELILLKGSFEGQL